MAKPLMSNNAYQALYSAPYNDSPNRKPTTARHSPQPAHSLQPRTSNRGPLFSRRSPAQENTPCCPPATDRSDKGPKAGFLYKTSPFVLTEEGFVIKGTQRSEAQCSATQTTVPVLSASIIPPAKPLPTGIQSSQGIHPSQLHARPQTFPWSKPSSRSESLIATSGAQSHVSHGESQSFTRVPAYKASNSAKGRSATSVGTSEELRQAFAKPHESPKGPKAEATSDVTSASTSLSLEAGSLDEKGISGLVQVVRTSKRAAHREAPSKCCSFDQSIGGAREDVFGAEARRKPRTTFPRRKLCDDSEAVASAAETEARMELGEERAIEQQGLVMIRVGPGNLTSNFWIAQALERKKCLLMAESNDNLSKSIELETPREKEPATVTMSPLSEATEQEEHERQPVAGPPRPARPSNPVSARGIQAYIAALRRRASSHNLLRTREPQANTAGRQGAASTSNLVSTRGRQGLGDGLDGPFPQFNQVSYRGRQGLRDGLDGGFPQFNQVSYRGRAGLSDGLDEPFSQVNQVSYRGRAGLSDGLDGAFPINRSNLPVSTQLSPLATRPENDRPVLRTPLSPRRPHTADRCRDPNCAYHHPARPARPPVDKWWERFEPPGKIDQNTPRFLRRTPDPAHTKKLEAYSLEKAWRDIPEEEKGCDGRWSPKKTERSLDLDRSETGKSETELETVSRHEDLTVPPRPALPRTASNESDKSKSDQSSSTTTAVVPSRIKETVDELGQDEQGSPE